MGNLKLVSDGTQEGTLIVNADTGERIRNVQYALLKDDVTHGRTLVVHIVSPEADIRIKNKNNEPIHYYTDDKGNTRLEYEDGTNIPYISELSASADLKGLHVTLKQYEDINGLNRSAESIVNMWDKDFDGKRELKISSIKDLRY